MKDYERIIETGIKAKPIGLQFDLKEVGVNSVRIYMSKKIAEKYLAQLSKALEDLDRQEDEHRGIK